MKSILCSILLYLGLSVPAFAVIWSQPALLEELNDPVLGHNAVCPNLSSDGLTMYFARRGTNGIMRLWEAYRDTPTGSFTSERPISELYEGRAMYAPWVSSDGLRLYYSQYETLWNSTLIHMAQRSSLQDPWQDVIMFTGIHNDGIYDHSPSLTPDELTLYYAHGSTTAYRLWIAVRSSVNDQFSNPIAISELNAGSSNTSYPFIMPDGLTIYFNSLRDGNPSHDLYVATRSSLSDPFGNIERLNISTDTGKEITPSLFVTLDASILYFSTDEGIWMSTAVPEPMTCLLFLAGAVLLRKK